MPVEINIEVAGKLGESQQLEQDIQRLVRQLAGSRVPPAAGRLTGWQNNKSQEAGCFLGHWCGRASNILAQYQTHTNPPRKANCRIHLTMAGQPNPRGEMPEHADDDIEPLEEATQEVIAQVPKYLQRNMKRRKVQVVAVGFAFPSGRSMGRFGKFQTFWSITRDTLHRLFGGAPIVLGMFVAAGLSDWNFLSGPALGVSSSAFAYVAFFVMYNRFGEIQREGTVLCKSVDLTESDA